MKTKFLGFIVLSFVIIILAGCPITTPPTATPSASPTATPLASPTTSPAATPTIINVLGIPGVTAPVLGATPVTSLVSSQYSGTINWSPVVSGTFAASTVYTATITLNPQVGYTLTGVAENSFTVAGAITTNGANSGVVTAEYIITAALVSPNIGNIMAITGGTFNNGITNMTVSSFRMSQYEITGEQYAAVMGIADPSYFSDITNNPVEQVNWYDALVFCNTLSMAESLIPVYTINGSTDPVNWGVVPTSSINAMWDAVIANWGASGYRLPTETEWEFAARGGNSTHSYTYAGSNIINEVAWYIDNSNNTIHAVGELSANELGFFDMSGNVWELCWDWSDAYPVAAQMDYRGATSGTYRVARGGCGAQNASFCAVVFRGDGYQYDRNPAVGFRVVRP